MSTDKYVMLIELLGVYDGWSIGVLPDGTMVNRWDKETDPRRWEATQATIDASEGKYVNTST